jgi:PBP1b-binding outer membrane lipoprotein LpoB
MRTISVIVVLAMLVSGCTVVRTTATVASAVVSTTAVVAGAAVKGTARAVSSIGEDDEDVSE